MKVLIYVLSCEQPPYDALMSKSMQTWDNPVVEGVETKYYLGRGLKEYPNTIRIDIQDSLENMGEKTVVALKESLKWNWDYMARVNSSCYVDKQRLKNHCYTLPKSVFQGVIADSVYGTKYMWGGCQIIMSRDIVEKLVENCETWRFDYTEDVAMSELASRIGIEFNGNGHAAAYHPYGDKARIIYYENGITGGVDTDDVWNCPELKKQFFFRIKQDDDRSKDLDIMDKLYVR